MNDRTNIDRLPPNSVEAEAGVLGCILLSPRECLAECLRKCKPGKAVFYDLRHQEIFGALVALYDGEVPVDIITLQEELKKRQRLEEVGGLVYLNSLPDLVPSAANLSSYLEIVLEKYFLRQTVRTCTEVVQRIYQHEGEVAPLLDMVERDLMQLHEEYRSGLGDDVAPKYLKRVNIFAEDATARLFHDPLQGEPGMDFHITFPMRIRRREMTLVSGDDGAGKSTVLSDIALHLAAQESGVCIASFEEPGGVSTWRLAAQLLGRARLPDTPAMHAEATKALAWLNERFWFYAFLGISNWRDVLETFRYAAEKHGCWLFVLDSVMRIGIADDDYAEQGFASAEFAKFAMDYNAHLFLVIHENKSDAKGKGKVRGSKLWTANANNIWQISVNHEKAAAQSKLEGQIEDEKRSEAPDEADIRKMEGGLVKLRQGWDTRLVMTKQRLPGTRQNAAKKFWFDPNSFQFRNHWEDAPVNYLKRWKRGHVVDEPEERQ